ncbi:MAG: carboxypeptidase-like regulatory domain-containing protein [Dysgonamonadaceae bacterium]|jgi:TonB-dependent SusC/RagA subfamily outer membrane receptor|nr:carboxypeptidase-like regulatory domain-containing protein [Dysgonamonadaceae bacterium]
MKLKSKCKWRNGLAFLLVMLLTAAIPLYAQDTTESAIVTLDFKSAPLKAVLESIRKQTGMNFVYNVEQTESIGNVSIQVKNETVRNVLTRILAGTGFRYEIEGRIITLHKANPSATNVVQQDQQQVQGVVYDSDREALAGVNIRIKGTTLGATTDAAGHFALTFPAMEKVALIFSFVGMETKEILWKGEPTLNVTMKENASVIDEVVVTGIFNKSRESYTGAAQTFTAKELRAAGNTGLITAIKNLDPSFNVIDDIEYGSDPNRLPEITLRGRTSLDISVRDLQEESNTLISSNLPLFVLDGFEVSLQRVIDMDQELVESITLLKDASGTALYGARGANGVVVITSKRPEVGKLRISYRGTVNFEAPDLTSYNLMNAREKLEYERAAGLYSSTIDDSYQSLQELYNSRLIEVERGVDTYWLKYPVHVGVGNRHSLTLDGGADNFRYSAGLGYNDVTGAMKESSRNTFSGNLFFQYELEKIKFQNDLTIVSNKNYNSPYGSFSEYAAANPIYTPYDDDGNLKKIIAEPYSSTGSTPPQVGNPLYNATLPYRDDGSYIEIQNNFAMEWYVTPELFLRGRLGVTKQESRTDKYLSREHTSFETSAYSGENYKLRGSYAYGTG